MQRARLRARLRRRIPVAVRRPLRATSAIDLSLLLVFAQAAAAAEPIGPTYDALLKQPEVTRFLWWGHAREPASAEENPEAFLFVATDSSWLLLEKGGEISGVGPESVYDTPPPLADPPPPIPSAEFERRTGREVVQFTEFCDDYPRLRASLEAYWEARLLWRGRVSMEKSMFLELFSAADGRWALVVHSPLLQAPATQACMAQRGFHSRLFEQPPILPPPGESVD